MAKNVARRLAYIKALERLLVAGTAGTFFVALARTLPGHLKEFSLQFQVEYTLDRFLRYGFLLWLLAYLFASSVNNDQENAPRNWRDVVFDIGQTVASLFSAVVLGFIAQGVQWGWQAYVVTLVTIFLICFISLLLFGGRASKEVNVLRISGAAVSAVSLVILLLKSQLSVGTLCLLLLTWLALFVILLLFICITVDAPPKADGLVEVTSVPPGATFAIVDSAGNEYGRKPTPGSVGLKAGTYAVRITQETIEIVVPSRTIKVSAELKPLPLLSNMVVTPDTVRSPIF